MAIPQFLSSEFRYKSTSSVTDVNTIISDLNSELTSLSDPWTDLGGTGVGPWRSPSRSDGAFIKITATRISATRIAWVVNDHNGMLVNNGTDTRQDIDTAGTTVCYYTGPFHVFVDSVRTTPECWWCAILDRYPGDLADPRPIYIASTGPRNNAGTLTGYDWQNIWLLREGSTSYTYSAYHAITRAPYTTAISRLTVAGSYLTVPFEVAYDIYWYGRVPQSLIVDSSLAFGTELTVPIDTGVTGTFKIVGLATSTYGRLAVRKA